MSNNVIRTVVIFGIIALVLGGAVVGAVRLTKVRNNSYATSHTANVAQTAPISQPQQKKDTSKSDSQPQQPTGQTKSQSPSPSSSQPQTPASTPTPSASTPNVADNKTSVAATAPHQNALPQTSAFSPADLGLTMILMMLAAFFGNKLLRTRADYRRYMGL